MGMIVGSVLSFSYPEHFGEMLMTEDIFKKDWSHDKI